MKNITLIFLIGFIIKSSELYSQYTGGSYDGYSSVSDSDLVVSIFENPAEVVSDFQLYQNYPNPFNPTTIISYSIYNTGFVTLKIFDLRGKELIILVNEKQNAGNYDVEFDASDFPAGVYFYRISSGKNSVTRKMILIK